MINLIISNVNPQRLLTELINANVEWLNASNDLKTDDNGFYIGYVGNLTIDFLDNVDMVQVQSIIDAHDPTPIPSAPSETEVLTNYLLDVDMRLVMVEMGLI